MFKRSITDLLKQLGVAALYASLLYIGESHFENGTPVGYFEPASGLALAVLLIGGKRYAWGILLGAFLIHATTDDPLWEAFAVALGDTLQALFGVWLLTRDGKFDLRLQSLRDYLKLILLGGIVSVAVGALVANTLLMVSGLLAPADYLHSLIQWWMGDTLGVVLIAPLILAWLGIRKDWRTAGMMAEATLILGLTILACQAIFLGWWPDNAVIDAKGYWMFLILVWMAIRIGVCGTTVFLVMTSTYALLGAIHGVGYFAHDITKTHLLNYWLFTVILSVVGMALATHFTERKQLEQQLSRRLRHRDVMDHISRISLSSATVEELLGKVLDEMLTVFDADRAYFIYPCDPDAPSWAVPMERTRPEWPGAFARSMVIPMTQEVSELFRDLLASTEPLAYGDAAPYCLPAAVAEEFSIRSMIQMVLRPRTGSPWVIGVHHCAQVRAYDEDEQRIFRDIGRRVADALNSLIVLKNLRESEENLHRAQAVGQVGSWLLDIATNRLEWSAETYRIFGIPQQESVDLEAFAATIHPDDRDLVLNAWSEAVAGAPFDIEHRIVADGQTRWVRERARIERDPEGRPLTGVGTVQDITERKHAGQALAESESRFREIFNTISDAIFIHDAATGRIMDVNRRMCEMYGFTREEALICGPDDLSAAMPPYSSAEAAEKIHRARTDGPQTFEWLARARDGHLFWVEVSLRFASISGNERILATVRDITERKQAQQALAESESRFRTIIEASPVPFALNDEQQNITYLNSAFIRTFGYTQEDIPTLAQWWPKAYPDPIYRQWVAATWRSRLEKASRENGSFEPMELNIRCRDGSTRTALVGAAPIGGSFEKIHLVTLYDITERKQMEQSLMDSEAHFRAVAQSANEAIITASEEGFIMEFNPAAEQFFGYVRDEIIGQPLAALMPERFHDAHEEGMGRVLAGGAPRIIGKTLEAAGLRKDGTEFPLELSLAQWQAAGSRFFTAIIRDITERKQAEEQIHNLAFYDALTQLPNRRLLNDRLEQTIAASKRSGSHGALMFLDLDNFKPLNDTHGHDVGDMLLITVACRIADCVRETDTVARFGGDEFVVMLGELDPDKTTSCAQAGIVAEKIRSALAEPYLLKIRQEGKAEMTVEHHCAASIGVMVFNGEARAEDIIKWADMAMYQAKELGRNRVEFFDSES